MLIINQSTNSLISLENDNQIELTKNFTMNYGRFLDYLEKGWITQVDFYNDSKFAIVESISPELGNRPQRIGVNIAAKDLKLIARLKKAKINFDVHPIAKTKKFSFLKGTDILLALTSILLIAAYFFNRNRNAKGSGNRGQGIKISNPFKFFKNKFSPEVKSKVRFTDVAGVDEVKEEFFEIVNFLKKPERYTALGAKIPKGVLVSGAPGTGKTLLARAIAGEANVPFFSCSASEFVELFVGLGASRIRDLFKRANKAAPCIIFIDEIDAIGKQRQRGRAGIASGANEEREQTLNQLLVEMDGFKPNKGIIVVGATNRPDILDSALLRPGRFDRKLSISLPDSQARLAILKVHAQNKKFASDVNLKTIAKRTVGFSGAELKNVLNEAAILTGRDRETLISMKQLTEAIEKTSIGLKGEPLIEGNLKKILSYHEIGHGLTASLINHHNRVDKVSIIPRGRTKSITTYISKEDATMLSRNQLLARIIVALAGRASESIIYGKSQVSTLAAEDFQLATSIARQMVSRYGMSKGGPLLLSYSSDFKNLRDYQVKAILGHCYNQAYKILSRNKKLISKLGNLLSRNENLNGSELRNIIFKEKPIRLLYKIPQLANISSKKNLRLEFDKILQELINKSQNIEKISSLRNNKEHTKFIKQLIQEAFQILEKKYSKE